MIAAIVFTLTLCGITAIFEGINAGIGRIMDARENKFLRVSLKRYT